MKPLKHKTLLIMAIISVMSTLRIASLHAQELIVSSTGSGTRCNENEPCSLDYAVSLLPNLAGEDQTQDIHVRLLEGRYILNRPLHLSERHSGGNGHRVVFSAAPGAYPVISGGMQVEGWKIYSAELNIWKAQLPQGTDSRQFFVNGKRAIRARSVGGLHGVERMKFRRTDHPYRDDQGFVNMGFITTWADMARWKNKQDIEFVFKRNWTNPRAHVDSIFSFGSGLAKVYMKNPEYFWVTNKGMSSPIDGPWYIENAYELLDDPGEFYLDKSTSEIYYLPREGEEMSEVAAILPLQETLIRIAGASLDERATNITFQGITFQHTTWLHPSRNGFPDAQNGVLRERFLVDGSTYMGETKTYTDYPKYIEYLDPNGAVVIKNATGIHFEGCAFNQLGYIGILTLDGTQQCRIIGNRFTDISHTAIQLGDDYNRGDREDFYPSDERLLQQGHVVTNNYIHDVAKEYCSASGIGAAYPVDLTIAHNEIGNLPYSGLHIGWGWEYVGGNVADKTGGISTDGPTPTRNVTVNNNLIFDVTREVYDGGHIYTLGLTSGPSLIRDNYLKNLFNPYGSIYPDEGSDNYHITNNVTDGGSRWLHVNSLGANAIDSTYTNISEERIRPGSQTVATHTFQDAVETEAAKEIRLNAGLEQPYHHLREGIQNRPN
ncbi:right-handed parallel beta-helix repeat-containing protein [Marinoscillum furvescens]|uniref:Parallel beta helix pectate lyase-like protein n=1 Tax=Marinoscillum furvescens DSM 4134 TaxID=1122208 RepID=A0A3D9L6P1_MARFU|nr:right-handed parallel beta-helix repeat-containing protein [Marinoscillum furvescens]REE02019.1 parallel beta helix pectate lyase-like protein [Marinoscillum furvescens DSM 4134]